MLHDLLQWLQDVPGAVDGDPSTSWSQVLAGSLHLWALIEGTHVLSLMLFAGTILMVDLRMLGFAFKDVPYSTLNNKILPYTIVGFALVMITGLVLFFSNPVHYYHNVWFRAKVIFIILAAANIFWFHYRVQKSQAEWDARPNPPTSVRLAAGISLTSWMFVIIFGRLMAFVFFECENMPPGSFGYAFADCESEMRAVNEMLEEESSEELTDESTGEETEEVPADESGETPAEEAPASAPADQAAPQEE
ncbi:MAG TPA: hypothetical protein PLN33_10665 [Hyphomonadaceae bacterium]|nr:hypothetical protein [Hyphomonadaceae bacterium]HPN04236.1 hypothetical protein [Hyphomonadaceae bacterium]